MIFSYQRLLIFADYVLLLYKIYMQSEINNSAPGPILNPKETAHYLGLHLITIYRLIKKGELPAFKLGGQWRFKKDLLDKWIENKINHRDKEKNG